MKKHLYRIFFFAAISAATQTHAQTILISTAAGTGSYGYAGDGGQATAAKLTSPDGVAVADSGKVYIAEGISNVVRKIQHNGVIVTIAGTNTSGYSGDGGAATAARLSMPSDVAVDTAGNVYIADLANNVIRKVNKLGIISTFAGTGTGGYGGDNGPAIAAKLSVPKAIATDSLGNLYIADQGNYRIRKVDAAGVITTVAGNGTSGFAGDGGPATAALISSPSGVAADRKGNFYFTDQINNRIRKVSAAGTISTIAGTGTSGYSGNGGPAISAQFNYPEKLCVDTACNVYVCDPNNNVVRKIDAATGIISRYVGNDTAGYSGDGGMASAAKLTNPRAATIDSANKMWVADAGNSRIRKVYKKPTVSVNEISAVGIVLTAHPNPVADVCSIIASFEDVYSGTARISVVDLTGREVYAGTANVENRAMSARIGLGSLSAGVYRILIAAETAAASCSIVVQRQ